MGTDRLPMGDLLRLLDEARINGFASDGRNVYDLADLEEELNERAPLPSKNSARGLRRALAKKFRGMRKSGDR